MDSSMEMQVRRMLATTLIKNASPKQLAEYQMMGALQAADIIIRAYNAIEKAVGKNGMQDILQQESADHPAEDPS